MKRLALLLALGVTLAACGLRTPVRPPEDTAPVIPGKLETVRKKSAVVVKWNRPEKSTDAVRLDDLAAFNVERKRNGEERWQRIATIDVVDQEKIRRRRDFSYHDEDAGSGPVSYRVRAVNADGQEGPPLEVTTVIDLDDDPTP